MHIPDGFLSLNTWLSTWLFSALGLGCCLKKVSSQLKERMIPLMGVMAAFIFAAQMLNFPVIGGTSGHLLGGVLAAVLLGPFAAAIVLAIVLVVQCFVFQDGGITALGSNIFNMSFVASMAGYVVYKAICKVIKGKRGVLVGCAVAAWVSMVLAALVCAVQLAMSGTIEFKIVAPAMIGIHVLIGIGEAVITMLVVGFILKVRPDLIGNKNYD